jgi:hypothetical protein
MNMFVVLIDRSPPLLGEDSGGVPIFFDLTLTLSFEERELY